MADEIKELKSSIEGSIAALKKNWEDRQAVEDKTGKELGEKIQETHNIVDALKKDVEKVQSIEAKQKELEASIARMGNSTDGEKGASAVELKNFNEMLKGYSGGTKQVSKDNAKGVAELEEKYIRRGYNMLEPEMLILSPLKKLICSAT